MMTISLLVGCGPYRSSTEADAMSEADHRERAAAERRSAEAHGRSDDPSRVRRSDTTHGGYEGILGGDAPSSTHATPPGQVVDPGAGHRSAARRARELAREHEAAADELVAFEAQECADVAPDHRASCPLLGSVRAAEPVEGGVAFELSDGVDAQAVLVLARCHAAFGRRRGREGMESCPLYIESVHVELVGRRLVLTTDIPGAVSALRERARAHVVVDP
jgi:hypothetical protein